MRDGLHIVFSNPLIRCRRCRVVETLRRGIVALLRGDVSSVTRCDVHVLAFFQVAMDRLPSTSSTKVLPCYSESTYREFLGHRRRSTFRGFLGHWRRRWWRVVQLDDLDVLLRLLLLLAAR